MVVTVGHQQQVRGFAVVILPQLDALLAGEPNQVLSAALIQLAVSGVSDGLFLDGGVDRDGMETIGLYRLAGDTRLDNH